MRGLLLLVFVSGCAPSCDRALPESEDMVVATEPDLAPVGEPIREMRQIFQGVSAWWAAHGHQLPGRTYGFNPAPGTCCAEPNQVCVPEPEIWTGNQPWDQIGFAPDGDLRYSYEFTPAADGSSFKIDASADLNCNGVLSDYQMVGTLSGNSFVGIDDVAIANPGE